MTGKEFTVTVKIGTPGQDLDEWDAGWLTTYQVTADNTLTASLAVSEQLEADDEVYDFRVVHAAATPAPTE